MQPPVRLRLILFITSLVLTPLATILVIFFARGWRAHPQTGQIFPTGLLLAQSLPDAAQIYINGQLKSATPATLNLPPGQYQVEIKKDGFIPWSKTLLLEAEIVTKAAPWLFPSVPSLKAVTTTGASLPTLSPDGSKVAFVSQSKLYSLDLTESPLGLINREPKLISNLKFQISKLAWSPDSHQLLLSSSSSAYLVDLSPPQLPRQIDIIPLLANWKNQQLLLEKQQIASLPEQLRLLLATASARLSWSPDEKKLLYTATASASLPDHLKKPLPGSSTQPQSRLLQPGQTYVYDSVEDRNFRLGPASFIWHSSSSHLIQVVSQITIIEYDGTNPALVYPGPLAAPFAAPYPSGKQLLILTNLNPATSPLPNLYALGLR